MLRIILILLAIAIAGVLVFAATKPDIFKVERSIAIKAPPEKIFPLINDYRQWTAWSPYETKDPGMKRSYGAATAGKGATYAWDGDKNVGQGSMAIEDSQPPSHVAIRLDFVKPFEAHNKVDFTLVPQGDTTKVTWAMEGPCPYFAKVMHVLINMDNMVGKDFEAGLARLKVAAEKSPGHT